MFIAQPDRDIRWKEEWTFSTSNFSVMAVTFTVTYPNCHASYSMLSSGPLLKRSKFG